MGSISVDFSRMVGHVRVVGMIGRINVSEVGVEVGAAVIGLSVGDSVVVGSGVGDLVCTFVGCILWRKKYGLRCISASYISPHTRSKNTNREPKFLLH